MQGKFGRWFVWETMVTGRAGQEKAALPHVLQSGLPFLRIFSGRSSPFGNEVAINNPFSGGFISNAHYWHKGIPWIQIEINRSLYEPDGTSSLPAHEIQDRSIRLREKIWNVLTSFWKQV